MSCILVGKVIFYYNFREVALIKVDKDFKVGDHIYVKGQKRSFKQKVSYLDVKIEDILHIPIDIARAGNIVGLKVDEEVEEGYLIYKIGKEK